MGTSVGRAQSCYHIATSPHSSFIFYILAKILNNMSDQEHNEERLPELSEAEKYEMEQMMVQKAFENSYKVVTKKTTFEELMNVKSAFGQQAILIYDPGDGWDEQVVEDLIHYFEDEEEYEKCAELKKILDNYV
jgi:hypothetical protein